MRSLMTASCIVLMRQVTDATDPTYWARFLAKVVRSWVPGRSYGWLRGEFRSVPRRVSTVPDSLQLGLAPTGPHQRRLCCAV